MSENGAKLNGNGNGNNGKQGAYNEVVEVSKKHGFISKLNFMLKWPNRRAQENTKNRYGKAKTGKKSETVWERSNKESPHSWDRKPPSQVQIEQNRSDLTLEEPHPLSSFPIGQNPATLSTDKKENDMAASMDPSQYHILAGEDTTFLIEILTYLVAPPTPTQNRNKNISNKTMGNGRHKMLLPGCTIIQQTKMLVKHDTRACRAVSKLWNQAIWEIMSPAIPGVISSPQLAQLKMQVCRLNLSCLDAVFVQNLKELWGKDTIVWGRKSVNSLQALLNYTNQSHEDFASMVSKEYKKYLLVKAVEVIAAARGEDNFGNTTHKSLCCWKEKCQPSKVVDMYWHSHMQNPRKYYHDCMALVGDIIDHETFYENPKHHKKSDYMNKLSHLLAVERAISTARKSSFPRTMLFESHEKDIREMGQTALRMLEMETCCG